MRNLDLADNGLKGPDPQVMTSSHLISSWLVSSHLISSHPIPWPDPHNALKTLVDRA
jgi:hypothetical protein